MSLINKETINICVVGQKGAGKSSLTLQYTHQTFPIDHDPCVEDIYSRVLNYDGKTYNLNFLDTATEDEYSQLKATQFKQADGFIIVYSIASTETFSTVSTIFSHIERILNEVPPTILVGNQTDLALERQIGSENGEALVKELGMSKYFQASAKSNINVVESYEYIAKLIIDSKKIQRHQSLPLEATTASISLLSGASSQTRSKKDLEYSENPKQKTFTVSHILESEKIKSTSLGVREVSSDSNSQVDAPSAREIQSKKIDSKVIEETNGCCCVIM